MTYLYCSEQNKFYPYDLKQSYEEAGVWPTTGVDISDNDFQFFINPPDGKVVANGSGGFPVLIAIPQPSIEQLIAQAESERNMLLEIANSAILPLQSKLMLRRASEEDKSKLNAWLDYIDAVATVNINTASDALWPKAPSSF